MNPDEYTSRRAGEVGKNEFGEYVFLPTVFPPEIAYDEKLSAALAEAERALGAWSGISRFPGLFDVSLYAGPMVRLEAALSSRIEGTRTTLRELLMSDVKVGAKPETPDVKMVKNLSDAMVYGMKRIKAGEVDLDLWNGLHKRLLSGMRGEQVEPGIIRDEQVYIRFGRETREEASFVPPPADKVHGFLKILEEYIRGQSGAPSLIRIGLVHYQFEAIHPYTDGNGRVGRMLITLLMAKWGLLPYPILNLSKFLLTNREDYRTRLLRVSQSGEWEEWLLFFLKGVREQADNSVSTVRKLGGLRDAWRKAIIRPRMPARLPDLIDYLFRRPIFPIPFAAKELKMDYREAERLVDELMKKGILREQTGRRRDRIFEAKEILDILTTLEKV
jgi:Fic family protein